MGVSKGFFQPGGESFDDIKREHFRNSYTAELARARAKGYTEEHDHEHGPQHLLDWATEYVYLDEPIKAAAMIAAARALLACDVAEHSHGTTSNVVHLPECGAIFGRVTALDGRSGEMSRCTLPPHDESTDHGWASEASSRTGGDS